MLTPWKESYDQPRQHIKKQRHYFANKGPSGQGYGFSSGHIWMWELDCEESWAPKNWCFWTVVLEKTVEHPLDCKEIQPVHPKGDLSWVVIGRTDAKAETPVLWPPDAKSWLTGKDPEGLGAGGEGDDRGWDGWMASPTPWAWVWVNSRSWWWTGRPGVLRSMGSQLRDGTNCVLSISPVRLCNPMDCSFPGSSVHGDPGMSSMSSRGSSQPRDRTQVSHTEGGLFTIWVTREAQ